MVAEYYRSSRDYYVYLDPADINELLKGNMVESDILIHSENEFTRSRIRLKANDDVKGEASRNVLWEANPRTFTFGLEYFKDVVLNDEIYERTGGYSETRYNASGDKIHVYRGEWFHAVQWKEMVLHRLKHYDTYQERFAEMRAKPEEPD